VRMGTGTTDCRCRPIRWLPLDICTRTIGTSIETTRNADLFVCFFRHPLVAIELRSSVFVQKLVLYNMLSFDQPNTFNVRSPFVCFTPYRTLPSLDRGNAARR
jgi:hypothetical protein